MSLSFKHMRGLKTIENIDDIYEMQTELGSGQFGTVYKAMAKQIGVSVALKVIKKSKVHEDQDWENLMKSELEALELLDHPHIVRVLDLCED